MCGGCHVPGGGFCAHDTDGTPRSYCACRTYGNKKCAICGHACETISDLQREIKTKTRILKELILQKNQAKHVSRVHARQKTRRGRN